MLNTSYFDAATPLEVERHPISFTVTRTGVYTASVSLDPEATADLLPDFPAQPMQFSVYYADPALIPGTCEQVVLTDTAMG